MGNLPDLFDLSGRLAVVTGGAGLLGSEFSKTLFQAGAITVVADIDEDAARSLAKDLNEHSQPGKTSSRAIAVQVDITSKSSVDELFRKVSDDNHHVDILINAAVIDPKFDPDSLVESDSKVGFEEYPLEQWQQALDVNLTGVFLCCQAAGKLMVSQGGGVMVNVSSIYGIVGPDQRLYKSSGKPDMYKPAFYPTTKAGILGLTRFLATYYAGNKIRVNALTPGGVFNEHDQDFVEAYSSRTVLGRMAEKNEMNGALLFLASDASSYMTGSNLVVDGGWTTW